MQVLVTDVCTIRMDIINAIRKKHPFRLLPFNLKIRNTLLTWMSS